MSLDWVLRASPTPLREIVACMWCRREMTAGEALLFHDACPGEPLTDWDRRELAQGRGERAAALAAAAAKVARDAASATKYAVDRGLFTYEDKMAYVSARGAARGGFHLPSLARGRVWGSGFGV